MKRQKRLGSSDASHRARVPQAINRATRLTRNAEVFLDSDDLSKPICAEAFNAIADARFQIGQATAEIRSTDQPSWDDLAEVGKRILIVKRQFLTKCLNRK